MNIQEIEDEIGFITALIGEAENKELVEQENVQELERLLLLLEELNG